jgi:hypothetical protein
MVLLCPFSSVNGDGASGPVENAILEAFTCFQLDLAWLALGVPPCGDTLVPFKVRHPGRPGCRVFVYDEGIDLEGIANYARMHV